MRALLYVAVGSGMLVAALALLAPAALLEGPVAAATQQRLRLVGATGPWWRGHGLAATGNGNERVPVDWRVDGAALLRGALVVHVGERPDAAVRGTLTVASAGVNVSALHARVPAAMIGALDPRWRALTLGGSVTVDAPAIAIAGESVSGALEAAWTGARVVVGDAVIDAGAVTVAPDPAQPQHSTIRSSGGDVAITGAVVDRAGGFDVDVALRPAATASAAAHAALALLGPTDASGTVHVAWRAHK